VNDRVVIEPHWSTVCVPSCGMIWSTLPLRITIPLYEVSTLYVHVVDTSSVPANTTPPFAENS
jgi:hypothetical protein